MTSRVKRFSVVLLAALIAISAVGLVGTASAQGPDNSARGGRGRDLIVRAVFQEVLDATGLTRVEVVAELREGKSLAQICEENGVDPQTVADTVKADATTRIEQAVEDGTITQQQADRLLGSLDDAIQRALNVARPDFPGERAMKMYGVEDLVMVLSEKSGLEPLEIWAEAREGKTLADIATANGIDPNLIASEALMRTTDRLRALVAEGTITQEQMDRIVAAAGEFYPQAMTTPLPHRERPIGQRIDTTLVEMIAEAAGVEPREVLRDLYEPNTLAEVATAYGLNPDDLIAQAEATITERVNEAVANGTISQEEADEFLSTLHDRLVERFNSPFRLRQNNREGSLVG